jgi:hypothetical protein
VVCTIHQPSSDIFHFFDDLCLLADGQVMYHGPAKEVVPYFQARGLSCPENFNPADFLFTTVLYSMDEQLKMISHDMEAAAAKTQRAHARRQSMALLLTDRIVDNKTKYEQMQRSEAARLEKLLLAWTNSSENAELERKIKSPLTTPLPDRSLLRAERPSQWYAFSLLAQRRWYDLLRHRMKVRVTFGQHLFFAVLIGTIFLRTGTNQNNIQDRTGGCFFICVQVS